MFRKVDTIKQLNEIHRKFELNSVTSMSSYNDSPQKAVGQKSDKFSPVLRKSQVGLNKQN